MVVGRPPRAFHLRQRLSGAGLNLSPLPPHVHVHWHGARAAGRATRHVAILRAVADEISPREDRPDRPATALEAKARLDARIAQLQAEAPRFGLAAATRNFIDHVAGVASRYGLYIFTCFDHPQLPPTSNDIERYFGASKAQLRRALGAASTAGSVAKNLGADYLEAFATAWTHPREKLLEQLGPRSDIDYARARESVRIAEQPATLRRSRRRDPERHVNELLARWRAGP